MRINLRCPYEQKDDAKRLGARWDPAKRTWYIVDIEDLTPFMRWIEGHERRQHSAPAKKSGPAITHSRHSAGDCGCNHIPPWEDCEHTLLPNDKSTP